MRIANVGRGPTNWDPRQMGRNRLVVLGCVLALVLSTAMWWVSTSTDTKITAYFDKTIGLYAGSAVRVLGIEVGQIEKVRPVGGKVRVTMRVERDIEIPKGANAIVVAPSLVSDRYIQLTPAYNGGPRMASGAVIPNDQTAAPAEIDQLFRNVKRLSKALGPQGANSNGALSELLNAGAKFMEGNGKDLNRTIKQLGKLAETLSDSKGDLFTTIDNLNKFTAMLARSDRQIREFYGKLADVTTFLASERKQIGAALGSLADALTEVKTFIKENRKLMSSNVDGLRDVTQALVDQRKALAEVIDVAPLGMSNFIGAYDAETGAVAVRGHLNELTHPPVLMVCRLVQHSVPKPLPKEIEKACDKIKAMDLPELPSIGETMHHLQQGELPPLPLPVIDPTKPAGGGR